MSIIEQVAESARLGRESAARNRAHDAAVAAMTAREPSARAYRDTGVIAARILTTAAERDAAAA
ncbi:hypothetical protein QMG61_05440 [Cryobacterium sp. PH31-AA6]|uniref:hypothetical protein n=1 Tax=Cryobacterium sp. PH31-AA6 TaxID=3046205 RepID=UPI0024BA1748|nr:hypothetical protein [Cryobacterium sp. PH31-AA6]MDJ0323206.1 hypothetical protein [Cryobacterium sp. PH31-AA6]